ncbi:hypothetical protein [Bacteroides heparinolyticus]|uniref:hypothetical protein n=1 Tax=Prevotella heparinolytica TaxID=28113 RepID=UPI0035A1C126
MKKVLTLLPFILVLAVVARPLSVLSQTPEKMSYQAVIRNSTGELVTSAPIGMQISILQGSTNGDAVYVETQVTNTNNNGLASIEIGAGNTISGNFESIDWANGPYFIKTETAIETPLDNYTITGTSQLLSVPYALYAKTAGNVPVGIHSGDMQYWNGSEWVIIPATDSEGAILQMINGIPTWVNGSGSDTIITVINPATGAEWMDRNLGATQVATSMTDVNSFGDLYQWGRGKDGHQKRTSGITTTLSNGDNPGHGDFILTDSSPNDWRSPQNDNLWQGVNGINNPCPAGFRIPTEAEWTAEINTWNSLDFNGAFESVLKLPCAGGRHFASSNNGALFLLGTSGFYWTSTVSGTKASRLSFDMSHAEFYAPYRAYGYSVRCIKD